MRKIFWKFISNPVLEMAAIAAMVLIVYKDAFSFLFFNDDPTGNFRWMDGRSIPSLFISAEGYPYYRPLVFVLWKALHILSGGYNPFWFHFTNIFFHALNGVFVWLLAYSLSNRKGYAFLAALLFSLYPFSYEAIGYVGALFHPLVTFFILLTLLFYRLAKLQGKIWLFYASHVTLILSLLTHENGAIAPFLIIALELMGKGFAKRSLTYLIEPSLFLLLWRFIPKLPGSGMTLQPLASFRESALHFLQAIFHPVAPLALIGESLLGIAKSKATLLIVSLSFLLLYAVFRLAKASSLFVLAILWSALASAPALLFLESAYVRGSPRLFYLTSIGASFLWGFLPSAFFQIVCRRRDLLKFLVWMMTAAMVMGIVWFDLVFINRHLDYFAKATDLVKMISEVASKAPEEAEIVYVNLPFYFGSLEGGRYPYPYGPTGAVVIPPYADLSDFIAINGGPGRAARGVVVRDFSPGWVTYGDDISLEELRELLAFKQVFLFDLVNWELFDLTGSWKTGDGGEIEGEAFFGDCIALVGHSVEVASDSIEVSLRWRCLEGIERSYTVFLHVYDSDGRLVAQKDSPPARGYIPTNFWEEGDEVFDLREVVLPLDLPRGRYTIVVGFYDLQTMERLPAIEADGRRCADDAFVLGNFIRSNDS